MLITCDYLEIYLRGYFHVVDTVDFQFVAIAANRLYADCYNVRYRGVPFGNLLMNPRMETMAKDACHFKLDNEQLYMQRTNSVLMEFLRATRLTFQSVTRLDIACDFQQFEGGLSVPDFVRSVTTGAIARRGREGAWNPHYVGGKLTGVSFGSRTSERHGRLYNKTELLKKDNKPYITEWHKKNGLVGADVWRLEFTLRGKEVKRMHTPERLTQAGRANLTAPTREAMRMATLLLSQDLLQGIFLTEMASYFTFVPLTKSGAKSKRRSISLITAASIGGTPELVMRLSTKRAPAGGSYRYKTAVRTLLLDYYLTKNGKYLETAFSFIERYNLAGMVRKRLPYWLVDFTPWIDTTYEYINILDCLEILNQTAA